MVQGIKKATSHKLGPGSLKFGATGSEVEFAAQTRSMKIEPKSKDEDALPTLSGEEIGGGDTTEWSLSGKILEEYSKDSLQVWAHVNAGKTLQFLFRPDNDKAIAILGSCKIKHIGWGGDVKERNEQDFDFTGVGMYQIVDAETREPITTYTAIEVDDLSDY